MQYTNISGISFQQLEICLKVNEYKSFSIAAKQMFLSQPTVSRKISELEKTLGIILFIRDKNLHIRPTPAGKKLFDEWEKVVNQFYDSINEASSIQEMLIKNKLRLSISKSIELNNFFVPFLRFFLSYYSDLEVEILIEDSKKIIESLLDNRIDIGVMDAFEKQLLPEGIKTHCVTSSNYYIGLLKSNPLSEKEQLVWSDLKMQKFILPQDNFILDVVNKISNKYHFHPQIAKLYKEINGGINLYLNKNNEVFITDPFHNSFYDSQCKYYNIHEGLSELNIIFRRNEAMKYIESLCKSLNDYIKSSNFAHEMCSGGLITQ